MSLKIKTYVSMLSHLIEAPVSAQDLSHLTGLHVETTRHFLKEMHTQKLVHIAQWDTRYNRRIKLPMYRLGHGTDAIKPPRLPSAVTTRRWKERRKIRLAFDPFYAICRDSQSLSTSVAD